MNKNLSLLTLSQIFGFTAAIITVFLSGIIGSQISSIKSLATLPTALTVVGTAVFTIFAAKIMNKIGRKLGFILGSLLTGTVVIETIFDWPGLGTLVFEAIQQRDYPLVQGCVLVISLVYVSVNFVIDILYQVFNPQVVI